MRVQSSVVYHAFTHYHIKKINPTRKAVRVVALPALLSPRSLVHISLIAPGTTLERRPSGGLSKSR